MPTCIEVSKKNLHCCYCSVKFSPFKENKTKNLLKNALRAFCYGYAVKKLRWKYNSFFLLLKSYGDMYMIIYSKAHCAKNFGIWFKWSYCMAFSSCYTLVINKKAYYIHKVSEYFYWYNITFRIVEELLKGDLYMIKH